MVSYNSYYNSIYNNSSHWVQKIISWKIVSNYTMRMKDNTQIHKIYKIHGWVETYGSFCTKHMNWKKVVLAKFQHYKN